MTQQRDVDTADFPVVENFLGKHFGVSPPPVQVRCGALSHQGLVRPNNEDHYLVVERRRSRSVVLTNLPAALLPPADDVSYVFAVADGVGGASVGELASMLALRSAWDQGPSAIKWNWIVNDREVEELREKIEIVFRRMNRVLLDVGQAGPDYAGMGTTLTAVLTVGTDAFIAHTGDSRAYLCHGDRLLQLTRDQTLAQECLDAGLPAPRSWYHKLTNCLGMPEHELQIEFHHIQLSDGDQLLLCSDGLSDLVERGEIAAILAAARQPQAAADALVAAALDRGGRDNVTVVVAQFTL